MGKSVTQGHSRFAYAAAFFVALRNAAQRFFVAAMIALCPAPLSWRFGRASSFSCRLRRPALPPTSRHSRARGRAQGALLVISARFSSIAILGGRRDRAQG